MASSESLPRFKAVLFDIGGVVVRSPFIAIAAYEREQGLPPNYLNCSIAARGPQGAWQRFERGELSLFSFYEAFGRDLSDAMNGNKWYRAYCARNAIECPPLPDSLHIDGRELFGRMMRDSSVYDPDILLAIRRIRAAGQHRIIALTNNFAKTAAGPIPPSELAFLGWDQGGATPPHLRALFDDFCDSSELGMRKPDPGFYLLACKRNGVKPEETVFLDGIGANLKAAKQLGMCTIHVQIDRTLDAVKQLERLLDIDLTSPDDTDAYAKL